MYIVEWCDHEGNQRQREFDNLDEARLEAASLEDQFDYVAIVTELEV